MLIFTFDILRQTVLKSSLSKQLNYVLKCFSAYFSWPLNYHWIDLAFDLFVILSQKKKYFYNVSNEIKCRTHLRNSIMADFLGSILGSMAGPPKASDKEIAERKKARELAKKLEERNKQESKVFRQKIEQQIDTFLKGPLGDENRNMTFAAMPKVNRSIVHDVAETAGLIAHSFGVEDVDRHVVIWRKEFAPW